MAAAAKMPTGSTLTDCPKLRLCSWIMQLAASSGHRNLRSDASSKALFVLTNTERCIGRHRREPTLQYNVIEFRYGRVLIFAKMKQTDRRDMTNANCTVLICCVEKLL
jgi:hypothetical protein